FRVLDLAVNEDTAGGVAEVERDARFKAAVLFVIRAERACNLARHVGHVTSLFADLRRLGFQIKKAAYLAGAKVPRGRRANDVDARGGPERRLIGAPVFDTLEAVEIGFRKKTAHVERTFDTIERRGEGARRHGGEVVDGGHAIGAQRFFANE